MSPVTDVLEIDDTDLFSTPDACRLAGVSFRQLDYWSRTGVIKPETDARGSGTQRRFTGAQVRDVAMVGRLRDLGVGLDAIEEVLHLLDGADGALIVIAPEFVRVAQARDVVAAVQDAQGAAIVLSPATLRALDATPKPKRCEPRGRGHIPPGRGPRTARW